MELDRLLKYGCQGDDVKELQRLLDSDLVIDGKFGKKTKAAVIAFQSANPPLKVDAIVGAQTWAKLNGIEPVIPTFVQPKDYKQYNYPNEPYSNHGDPKQTIKSSGCGPTAAADALYTLYDKTVDPPMLAKLALKWGDRSYSNGTNWSFFKHLASEFKVSKMVQTTSLATLKSCLDAGGYAVCSMSKGYWTNGGHYICAWKYDNEYMYCNDPASSTRKKQKITQFTKERKAYFCFFPKAE